MAMGRIFKTPSDDSTEATLRAMHITNELDNYYEKGVGWIRTIIAIIVTMLVVSAYEFHSEISIWENTADWLINKLTNFVNGLVD
tara:strand:- start:8031 stop:8285 length:255 start_codon:yes stop_codon:yes gene_type:complete